MEYTSLSKEISYILRHNPKEYGLNLDENGYVKINDLLYALNKTKKYNRVITIADINYIINNSDKKRFEIVDNNIRALYGHSIEKKIEHTEKKPPQKLYHGTYHNVLDKILKEGLKPMKRQFVHLSDNIDTAKKVGERRDVNPVILQIDSESAFNDGIRFYMGNEDVWLCDFIDAKYITIVNIL